MNSRTNSSHPQLEAQEMLNRLTKKVKRLIESEAKGISAYDLARIVQVMGVFERDAFMAGTSRQFIHSVRYSYVDATDETKTVDVDFEVTFREYFDDKKILCEELMELTTGDEFYNLQKENDAMHEIPFTPAIRELLADWLASKDEYCEVYANIRQIEKIQAELYEEERTRRDIRSKILNEAAGGLFD